MLPCIKNILIKLPLLLLFFFMFSTFGFGQVIPGVYVYPEHNQSKEQQKADENNCYSWAQQQVTENPSPQGKHGKKKALKGAGIGALGGAVLGRGKGAVIGGAAGAFAGHRKAKKEREQEKEQGVNDIARAYSSCLRAKGYSVD